MTRRTACALLALALAVGCRSTGGGGEGVPRSSQQATESPPPSSASAQSLASASATPPSDARPDEPPPTAHLDLRGGRRAARGTRGMVSSVEAHATRAGVAILEAGGNAADAAVATAYALAVTHPSAGNIGGGGIALVRPRGGPTVAIEFRERAPAGLTQARFDAMIAGGALGPTASGVPGTVAGLEMLHERFGRLSRARVLERAIALAKDGHQLGERQAKTIRWAWPELARDPAARAIFGNAAGPLGEGARLRQPELAAVLERIASAGAAGFYDGPTAERIADADDASATITRKDLADYRAVARHPLQVLYRGVGVHVAPPPSAGGVALAQMLLAHEHFRTWEKPSADALHFFIEIARRAHATRRFDVVDPDSTADGDMDALSKRWLTASAFLDVYPPIDPHHQTPSSAVHELYGAAVRELEHTTHLSVVDGDGMAVSLTTTLSAGFGARYVVPGTGIVMNNAVAAFGTVGRDVPKPGRRMTTSMSPTLLVDSTRTAAALGSPGGDTIPNTVAQLVMHLVNEGLRVEDAVDAPRVHHGFVPDEVRYEGARPIPRRLRADLAARGHRFSAKRIPIGDANVVVAGEAGLFGYADPREGGLALGPADPAP